MGEIEGNVIFTFRSPDMSGDLKIGVVSLLSLTHPFGLFKGLFVYESFSPDVSFYIVGFCAFADANAFGH